MTQCQLELPFPEPEDADARFRRILAEAQRRVQPLIDRMREAEYLTAEVLNFRFGSAA